jgi:plastocyanin
LRPRWTLASTVPRGLPVDKDVVPGQTITVQVKLGGKALPFFCKYHRTSGMVGSLLAQG